MYLVTCDPDVHTSEILDARDPPWIMMGIMDPEVPGIMTPYHYAHSGTLSL